MCTEGKLEREKLKEPERERGGAAERGGDQGADEGREREGAGHGNSSKADRGAGRDGWMCGRSKGTGLQKSQARPFEKVRVQRMP